MNAITIAGGIETALSHLALVGLAALLDEERGGPCTRFRWTEDVRQRAQLVTELRPDEVATTVRSHATRHTTPASWVSQRVRGGIRDGTGLFTPRAKGPGEDEWESFAEQRTAARRALPLSTLDERLITALGEPAWWLTGVQGRSADDGASRWEMKTRNQGQEFIVHRFSPLAEAVAARDTDNVLAGLIGDTLVDELGKNAPNSRTGTGLSTPGPVDSAVAWCALWGLHSVPTFHRLSGVSQSAGVWPRRGVHPVVAVLPVFTVPVTARRFGEILGTQQLDLAAFPRNGTGGADNPFEAEAACAWLVTQGVRALARFPILKTGSGNAPERQVLNGEVRVL